MIAGATIAQERYQSPPAEAEECKTTAHYLVVHVVIIFIASSSTFDYKPQKI